MTAKTKLTAAQFGAVLLGLQKYFIQPENNKRAAFITSLILIVLLAHAAARISWYIATPEPQPVQAPRGSSVTAVASSTGALNSVADLHLFGKVESTAAPVAAQPIKAPETRLNMELNGVIAPEIPEIAMAIIVAKGQSHKAYSRGDKLPGNVVLKEIYADHVLLSRSGKLETLRIKKTHEDANITTVHVPSEPVPDETVQQFRQELSSSPALVWKKTHLSRVMDPDTGALQGYRITYDDPALMQAIGLQPDDVITAVNGIPASDTQGIMALTKDPSAIDSVELSILRDGQPTSLSVAIN